MGNVTDAAHSVGDNRQTPPKKNLKSIKVYNVRLYFYNEKIKIFTINFINFIIFPSVK